MDPDDEAVPYSEFLALARDEGLITLEIQVVQSPSEANGRTAVVVATARSAQAGFSAVGEAAPHSAPEAWQPFLTTLAELRAKARALRDLSGLDHAVQEELAVPYLAGSAPDEAPQRPPPPRQPAPRAATPRAPDPVRLHAPSPSIDADEEEDLEEPDVTAQSRAGVAQRPIPAPAIQADPDDAPAGLSADEAPSQPDDLDDDLPPDHEGIDPDMVAKLKKLAISIADLEGTNLSDAEATQKLDDFFLRAFKHTLGKATRMEGQRVVQRLSGDLVRLRSAASNDKD